MYNSLYDALERIYPSWNGGNTPVDFRVGESNLEHLLLNLEELHEIPSDININAKDKKDQKK